ncbi:MAG: PHP domain-containing protein [Anaerolineae bacterium]|nr:PHP domain-containing protein [Anaerolineae bacterium]
MKIDLHVHAKERSACGESGEEEMLRAAVAYGLDGLVFTDHHRFISLDRLEELNRKYAPFRVFGGIEISVDEGEDVLVLGARDSKLETRDWSYARLFAFVRERGGYLALAHPFRYHDRITVDIDTYPPDAIELHSKNTGACDAPLILAVLERLKLPPICNSDAHRAEHVGVYYNQLAREPGDERELIQILKAGEYTCASMEKRIAAINREVEERERLIRGMIARGQSRDDYRRETGHWPGHYDRVAEGKSYRI